MKLKKFNVGDKVFAKIKGYPAWPAIVTEDLASKYNVRFYGTGETGIIKAKDVFYYLKHKKTFVKSLKRRDYVEAVEEIEKAIEECGTDGNADNDDATAILDAASNIIEGTRGLKRKRSESSEASTGGLNQNIDDVSPPFEGKKIKVDVIDTKIIDEEAAGESDSIKVTEIHQPVEDFVKYNIDNELNRATEYEDDVKTEMNKKVLSEIYDKTKDNITSTEADTDKIINNNDVTSASDSEKVPKEASVENDNKLKISIADFTPINVSTLKAIIDYGNFVRQHSNIYKEKPVEKRTTNENEVVFAEVTSEKFVAIKYNRDAPPEYDNEFDRAEYDETLARNALSLKAKVEDGSYNVEDDSDLFESQLVVSKNQLQEAIEREMLEKDRSIMKWLKTENELLHLDALIKACLGLEKADPKMALIYLNQMLRLDVQPLMLKKNPTVVDMIKRLRRYIGNTKVWNMSESELKIFKEDAYNIREKAVEVYKKFASLFETPSDTYFWDYFKSEVDGFRKQVVDWDEHKVILLTSEPGSRQTFLKKVDEEPLIPKKDKKR